jgi:hypothetical protein
MYGQMEALTRCDLAISSDSFPSTCGLEFGNCLRENHALPERVSGNGYLNILRRHSTGRLEDVPLSACLHMRLGPEVLHHKAVLTDVSSSTIIALDWSRT